MPKAMPNIEYNTTGKTPVVDSFSSLYNIPFEKPKEYFSNLESKNRFIKGCEWLIRNNDRYSKYINYLKTEVKLNHCQLVKGLTDLDCKIEMHHGPIFTLYDYCDIVINWFLIKNYEFTTFDVADLLLEEHKRNHIHVVMLSSSFHEEVHEREIFINVKQAWGDLGKFIKIYGAGVDKELREKYNRYMDKCMLMDTTSYDILNLNVKLK